MTNFMEDLWESIFTAGPTPTLLLATNATFAALQLVLLALLIATYSIHFLVLSAISGGLWWSINWFASEVRAAQSEQAQQQAKREGEGASTDAPEGDETGAGDTETEAAGEEGIARGLAESSREGKGVAGETTGARLTVVDGARKRRSLADSTGDLSTDSEWEKVSGDDKP